MENEAFIQRRLRHQKLRRKARRGEIMLRRIYKFIRFLIVIGIFFCINKVFNSHYWYFPSDLYGKNVNERIEIKGNNIVSSEKILAEMRKYPQEHKPLYKINPEKIAHGIEQLTPVKRAYIRRYWFPARYSVLVEEVTPAIIIAPAEDAPEVAAFSHEGRLISREYLPLKDTGNAVKILSYGTNGDDYENWNSEKIGDLYKIAKLLEEYSGEKVEYIDLRIPHNAFAKTQSAKLRLGETDVSLKERIKRVQELLPQIKKMGSDVEYGDLSWKESVYIKMK